MDSTRFTTDERAGSPLGSIPILARYVWALRTLRILFVPAVLCSIIGTAGYQLFLWASGEFANCVGQTRCLVPLSILPGQPEIPLSLGFLLMTAVGVVTIRVVGWIMFEGGGQWAALHLHSDLIRGVGRTRTTFFDEHPSGKLINRIVRDFDSLRTLGPIRIGDTLNALIEVLLIAGVVALAHPLAALAVLPTIGAFFYIQQHVAPMMQRCSTLRSIRLGEMLHRETDVIEGARTFVLYNHERTMLHRLRGAVEGYAQMHVLRATIEAWGRIWSQSASAAYGALALFAVAYASRTGEISLVLGSVIITAVFRLGGAFGWLTWSAGYLFESAAHARRVFEYVDLPGEEREERAAPPPPAPAVSDTKHSQQPTLEFVDYTMSYRATTPCIISNLSLTIAAGSKVGLIGRTGAGKTSFAQSLLRMVYVHRGDIRVGGRSLFSLPIEEARTLFALVPQDAYLFEGTVRSNIDRYRELPDAAISRALQAVQLPFALDAAVEEGGRNLSVGERQLVCLARVILSKRPIVLMDEPTSGVDAITDAIVQRVIREELAGRTILTIAHRLETLARLDRIIQLQDGRVIQDGLPSAILPRVQAVDLG